MGCGGGLLSWGLQSNAGQPPADRNKGGYLTVRTLDFVKRGKRSRNCPRKEKVSLVPAGDADVLGSPSHESQALTTGILAAEGAAGSFSNGQRNTIFVRPGLITSRREHTPNTKPLVHSLDGHLSVLRGQIYTREAMWTRTPPEARSAC